MYENADRRRGLAAACVLAATTALLAGCSSGPSADASANAATGPAVTDTGAAAADAAGLQSAATELWVAREAEDWTTVFRYQDAETREAHAPDEYAAWAAENEPFVIRGWTFGEVLAEGPMGWVEVTSTTALRRYPTVPPRETQRWEKWHRLDGNWYPVPSKATDAFPSSPALRDRAEEDRLRARFGESWDARLVEDWTRLFEMSDPDDMANVEMDGFADAHGKVLYLDHEIHWVEVVGDTGLVQVGYLFKLNDPNLSKLPPRSAVVNERWIKRDDTWFRDLVGSK